MCDFQEEKEDLFEVKELRAQLALKEEELQRMRKEAEELTSVRQKNYVLQSKVHKHSHLQNNGGDKTASKGSMLLS